MKIDMRVLCKRVGIIFLALGLLTIVETAISKGFSEVHSKVQQVSNDPIVKTVTPDIVSSAAQPKTIQPVSGKLSLEQIHVLSQKQEESDNTRGMRVIPAEQLKSDKFTQSQAHMSLPEIKKIIESKYNTKPYQKLIDVILAREKEYQDYYVFYHGMDNVWRVPQDLYTKLYIYFKKLPQDILSSFVFLRFGDVAGPSNVQEFLVNKLKDKGLINDHELGNFLYAVNIALFGNVGVDPECTWQYFLKSRGHTHPDRATYEKILDAFGISHHYIDALMALTKLYKTKEETIVQVFVPKNKVDQIGYLAWIRGIPAHKKTMDMVLQSVESKKFPKTAPALDYYTKLFKDEQEKNPIFSNLLDRVRAGDFELSYFLKFYRNYPEKIDDINSFEARLIFTPEVLLNPLSGVKIFRYSMATDEQLKKYQQKLDDIFKKMVAETLLQ